MKNETKPKDQERRAFIKKSTIVGATVAATAVASTSVVADVVSASTEKPEQKGYHVTQHVLDYYKSADI